VMGNPMPVIHTEAQEQCGALSERDKEMEILDGQNMRQADHAAQEMAGGSAGTHTADDGESSNGGGGVGAHGVNVSSVGGTGGGLGVQGDVDMSV